MSKVAVCVAFAVGLLGGCAEEQLPGEYFLVTVETSEDVDGKLKDECNDPPEAYRDTFEYRVLRQGPSVQIFIGDAFWANGSLVENNDLSYQSPIFVENRGSAERNVRWAVRGDVKVSFSGGDGAWDGEERVNVVSSTDPDVPASCSYWLDITGVYQGEVK